MSQNWRARCDWCNWPLVADGEAGCWATNCSFRPGISLTPAQAEVVELKQTIRRLEARPPLSTSAYMDSAHYRVNKAVSALRVLGGEGDTVVLSVANIPLRLEDLEAVIRDTADYYRASLHKWRAPVLPKADRQCSQCGCAESSINAAKPCVPSRREVP